MNNSFILVLSFRTFLKTHPTSIGYFENTSSVVNGNLVSIRYPMRRIPPLANPMSIAASPHTLPPTHGVSVTCDKIIECLNFSKTEEKKKKKYRKERKVR